MSRIQFTQVEPVFASPIMLFQVLDCEVLNRQVVEEAQAMRARLEPDPRSIGRRSGLRGEEPGCLSRERLVKLK
jgi:hypothetical protein